MFDPVNIFTIVISFGLIMYLWYIKEKIIPKRISVEQKKRQFSTTVKRIKQLERNKVWADRLMCISLGLLLYGFLVAVFYPFQAKLMDIASHVLQQ